MPPTSAARCSTTSTGWLANRRATSVVASEIVFGEARRHDLAAAGGLQLLDHVASEEARAAGDQHAGVAQLHAHRLMNSSTHSFT